MKKNQFLIGALCLSFLFSCSNQNQEVSTDATQVEQTAETKAPEAVPAPVKKEVDAQFLVQPGQRFGQIKPNMDKAALVAALGEGNVSFEKGAYESGVEYTMTYAYKGTKNELEIVWEDSKTMQKIRAITVMNVSNDWAFPGSINVETPLSTVQKINGQAFELYGFHGAAGWGVADAIKGTALENMVIAFEEPADYANMAEELKSDGRISSALVLEKQQDPKVRWIRVNFK